MHQQKISSTGSDVVELTCVRPRCFRSRRTLTSPQKALGRPLPLWLDGRVGDCVGWCRKHLVKSVRAKAKPPSAADG